MADELTEMVKDGLGEIDRPYIRDGKPVTFRDYADILRDSYFKRVDSKFANDPVTADRLKKEYANCQDEDSILADGFDIDRVMTFRKRPE